MRQPTVLVADDEPSVVAFIALVLDVSGARVVPAYDGAQLLALSEQVRPSLFLIDVMMPKLDGRHACRRLRAEPAFQGTPIVLFSAAPEAEVDWRNAGASEFLQKPFDSQQLRELLARWLDP